MMPPQQKPTGLRRRLPAVATAALAVLFFAIIATATFSLRTLFYDFGTHKVEIHPPGGKDTSGTRFDRALLDHIGVFEYIESFDHVLRSQTVPAAIEKTLWMDRCEVRQGDFYRFMQWHKHHMHKPISAPSQPRNWTYRSNNLQHAISGRLEAPANGVTYYDAHAYCRAVGGRLPFGEEWIAAASGRGGRLYPWGNEFNGLDWPYIDPLLNATQRCGLHKETATPDGIRNMGGAVSEWTRNRNSPLTPTIHGGNAYNQPREIYSLNRLYRYAPPEYRSPYVGFRCVYNKPIEKTPWKTPIQTAAIKPGEYETGIPSDARLPSLLTNLPRDKIHLLKQLFQGKQQKKGKTLFVMAHEVTRRQYADFLRDPLVHFGLYADRNEPKDQNYRPPDWAHQIEEPDLPVVNVDWWSAHAFAAWAGGRLPTASEWIAAASSRGRNIYPWGNEFIDGKAVSGEQRLTSTRPVGAAGGDITPDGLLDMGGNASEWTKSTDVAHGSYIIVVKGGNYLLPGKETTRIDFKNTVPPNHRSSAIGLRVVFDHRPVAAIVLRETGPKAETKPGTPPKPVPVPKADDDLITKF